MSTRVPTYFPQIPPYLLNIPLYFPKIQSFLPKIPLYLPKIPLFLPKIPLQCCQEENQTKESQNLTFIRPHFYQKSNQNWSWPLYFSGQNLNCSKNIIPTLGTVTFICKKNLDLKENLDIFFFVLCGRLESENLTFWSFQGQKRTFQAKKRTNLGAYF